MNGPSIIGPSPPPSLCSRCAAVRLPNLFSEAGVKHHKDIDHLIHSAGGATGCPLCNVILKTIRYVPQGDPKYNAEHQATLRKEASSQLMVRAQNWESMSEGRRVGVYSRRHRELYGTAWPEWSPLAFMRIFADDENVAARRIPERQVFRHAGSDGVFRRVHRWIRECDESHVLCQRSSLPPLPTLVIDLGLTKDAVPRLVASNGASADYIALSHRWGETRHITTTMATLEQRKESIPIEILSKTWREAIQVTRMLGVRYLWIDALCIIQDSAEDWEREAARMGDIYRDSFLTLTAAASGYHGIGGEEGLLTSRAGWLFEDELVATVSYPSDIEDAEETIHLTAQFGPWEGSFAEKYLPLHRRAWTMQERLLPRRVLSYESMGVHFRCKTHLVSERGDETNEFESLKDMFWPPTGSPTWKEVLKLWYQLLDDYSIRELTKDSDKFPAISGLAHQIQNEWNMRYIAGIWESELLPGLLWSSISSFEGNAERPTEYRAPSWTWAAMNGWTSFKTCIDLSETPKEGFFITIHQVELNLKGADPTGQVLQGTSLLITGMLRRAIVRSEPREHPSQYDFIDDTTDWADRSAPRIGWSAMDFELQTPYISVVCLRVIHNFALILVPHGGGGGNRYERVGLAKFESWEGNRVAGVVDADDWFRGCEMQEIVLL